MKKQIFSYLLLVLIACFGAVGVKETYNQMTVEPQAVAVTEKAIELKEPTAEFIAGPLAADVGELCVFRLNDPGTKADWIIVPSAACYIDSSGSSLAFASKVPATYTIIAAIVENGVPKILTHICEYGLSPEPTPHPTPEPTNLTEWVTKNIPEGGRSQSAALASCYEATAEAIEKHTVRTTDAAFSMLRTATQTKIRPDVWGPFLDQLAVKVTEKLGDSNDIKTLGAIFTDIANGLKVVFGSGDSPEEVLKLPFVFPAVDFVSPPSVDTDPTGKPVMNSRSRR